MPQWRVLHIGRAGTVRKMSISLKDLPLEYQRQAITKLQTTAKPSKYHNIPTTRGTIKFDSQKEARRYDELILMLQSGTIRNLKLQPQFTLQESYITPDGERIGSTRYIADFSYEDASGQFVVEDVKSRATRTSVYRVKIKRLREKYGIKVQEI